MSKLILAVDDSAPIRKLVSFAIHSMGYQALVAGDGVEAISLVNTNEIDLIITDLNMPHMDGIALIRNLRQLPRYTKTPILLLTTESDTVKKTEGKAAGATGWIVKPFVQEQLTAVINKVLVR